MNLRGLAPLRDGSFFAKGGFPRWGFAGENAPLQAQAFLHVWNSGGAWIPDTIAVLDIRNMPWSVAVRGESSRFNSQVSLDQPFADHDLTWTDWEAGSVGIVRRNGPPGTVEVIKILAKGDTLRHRRFSVPAVPIPRERAEGAIEAAVARLRPEARDTASTRRSWIASRKTPFMSQPTSPQSPPRSSQPRVNPGSRRPKSRRAWPSGTPFGVATANLRRHGTGRFRLPPYSTHNTGSQSQLLRVRP